MQVFSRWKIPRSFKWMYWKQFVYWQRAGLRWKRWALVRRVLLGSVPLPNTCWSTWLRHEGSESSVWPLTNPSFDVHAPHLAGCSIRFIPEGRPSLVTGLQSGSFHKGSADLGAGVMEGLFLCVILFNGGIEGHMVIFGPPKSILGLDAPYRQDDISSDLVSLMF